MLLYAYVCVITYDMGYSGLLAKQRIKVVPNLFSSNGTKNPKPAMTFCT